MAIEGPLRELALCDLFQLLDLSQKTGVLTVTSELRSITARVHFDRGRIVAAESPSLAGRLGRLLLLAGKATTAQIESALEAQRATPGRRIGEILIEQGSVAASEVEQRLRFQVEETVFELIRWTEGSFRFDEAPAFEAGTVSVRLPVEGLLMEGMRRADEWSNLTTLPSDAELIPVLAPLAPSGAVLDLQPFEWEVLGEVDGSMSLRGIAQAVGHAEFDVARAIFSLASVGVVEVGARERVVVGHAVAEEEPRGGVLPRAERALTEGRPAEASRLLEEYPQPESGDLFTVRGRVAAAEGRLGEAISLLERAVRLDPLYAPAYLHLGSACLRKGDLNRAVFALSTFLRLPHPVEAERGLATRALAAIAELREIVDEVGP